MADYVKPLTFSTQLPYADNLEEEANVMWNRIKTNLTSAIKRNELWPGAMYWSLRLQSYISVYDFHFSKEDHIGVIKLLYNLILLPNVSSGLLQTWCGILCKLLKKHRLVSPKELQLEWKPLFQLLHTATKSKFKRLGMKTYSDRTISMLRKVIGYCRCYFPIGSTQEMLDEWKPLLCPFDASMIDGSEYFSDFLPTLVLVEHQDQSFKLWLEELARLWLIPGNHSLLEDNWVKLFVRVAQDNIGYIDWSQYMEQIFGRILFSFNLPMGPPEYQIRSQEKSSWTGERSASMIISILGGKNKGQLYLSKLMVSLQSYYHPSNIGSHTGKLMAFLKFLSQRFVNRLKRERHYKLSWEPQIPSEFQLTEDDIDAFVECLLPAIRLSFFTKRGILDVAMAVKNIAELRPKMILPELIERTYAALETLTEPHQVVSMLSYVSAVSRTLVSDERYPEGRTHVFELLKFALPGLDLNDIQKMLTSSLLISTLSKLIVFVDCSSAIGCMEMSEVEADLCSMTSQSEDFVLQLIDRIFQLIENTAVNIGEVGQFLFSAKQGALDSMINAGVTGTIAAVLSQTSLDIYKVALDKVFRFASSNVFAHELAGKMCTELCQATCEINPELSLKRFIPHLTSRILEVLDDSEQVDAENPDVDLLWNLQLLSSILKAGGNFLPQYADELLTCLKKCVHLKSKKAAKHAAMSLNAILDSITQICICDSHITSDPLDLSVKDHLYIRDWGKSCRIEDANIKWHIPSEESLKFVNVLLNEFLKPELQTLQDFMDGHKTMDREEVCQTLELIEEIIKGITSVLPGVDGPLFDHSVSSVVPLERQFHIASLTNSTVPDCFSRQNLINFTHKMTRHLIEKCENDTKSLLALICISDTLLLNHGINLNEFENRIQGVKQMKLTMGSNLLGKKKLIRPYIITKCYILHQLRLKERSLSLIRKGNKCLLDDISTLTINAYPEVRIAAQKSLNKCLEVYLFSCRTLLPFFITYLTNSDGVTHEQFKGSLYVMVSPLVYNSVIRNWDILADVLPALVQADHSEKSSILALITHFHNLIQKSFDYLAINHEVTDGSVRAAEALCNTPNYDKDADKKRLLECNEHRYRSYMKLVEKLVTITESQHDLTQWRFTEITIKLLVMLIRQDVPLSLSATRLLVTNLVNDSVAIRKVCVYAVALILQKLKRPHKRQPVILNGIISPSQSPGEREDNKWLCLMGGEVEDENTWNSNQGIVNKTKYGFYCYPKVMEVYAPTSEQPKLNRSVEEMNEVEALIYETIANEQFMSKLTSLLSLEERKGHDQFNTHRVNMFKNLFRNFGSCIVDIVKPYVEKMAIDSQESCQRCSCEIITGLVRGMKHWDYAMIVDVKKWLEPLLAEALARVQPETADDWYQCYSEISADRDPRRINWIFKLLLVPPLIGDTGSFVDCSRLSVIQAAFAQQQWRIPALLKSTSEYLFDHLDHSFKNVREKIGSLLSNIYLMDVSASGFQRLYSPSLSDMVDVFVKKIPDPYTLVHSPPDSKVLRTCKTAMSVIINSYQPSAVEFFHLFSKIVPLSSYEGDDEIPHLIIAMCKQLSRCELTSTSIHPVLKSLKEAVSSGLWKVKIPVLLILQVLVFCNLFLFTAVDEELRDFLLKLVEDKQIEVREIAASTVSGLVHCGYFSHDNIKKHFIKLSRTKLSHKSGRGVNAVNSLSKETMEEQIVLRHSGVLGLAALVEAHPYTLPEWLPEVLDELSSHLNDPAPISTTVKKTISEFKRTHHDNWREHRMMFTEDQLMALSEMDVSPSYYA